MAFASLEQISTVLNMTPQMVNRHVKLHGMPRVSRGEYEIVKCVHWYIAYKDRQIQDARKGTETEAQARQRLVIAEANLRELEYAKARGKVVDVEVAKGLWAKLVLAFRAKVLLIPTKMPALIVSGQSPNEVRELLEKEVTEALNELSRANIDTSDLSRPEPAREGSPQARKPAIQAKRKRVGRQGKSAQPFKQRRAREVENGTGGVPAGNDGCDHAPKSGDGDSDDSSKGRENGGDQQHLG